MLPKKHRVNKGVFEAIMKDSIMVSSPLFVFRYRPSSDEFFHFAVVVPKSVSKTASERNSLRRKGYLLSKPFISGVFTGVLFFKKEAKLLKNEEISENIKFLFKKAGIL
jgi:ribonuclease P protein component